MGNLGRAVVPGIDVAVGFEDPIHRPVVEADEHDPVVATLKYDFVDWSQFNATPFLALVVRANWAL